jgi:putative ABC transport system substrate-binding protein
MRLIGLAAILAVSCVLAPLAVKAQAPKIPKIGFLAATSSTAAGHVVEAFRQALRELGYVEGKTVVLEIRYGEARPERLPELARELVGLKMDVIVAGADGGTAAVKRETQTIPIVMGNSSDPVGTGFVASLARPGGNVTGLSTMSPELSGKRLELSREGGRTLQGRRGGSRGSRAEFVRIDHRPTELPQGGLETMASLHSPPL